MSIEAPRPAPTLYEAGTLRYTRSGLALLFFWLLWGYFVYGLMETVPTLLPILLKQENATNVQLSFITTSLNVLGNFFVNPIVSFRSDRHRGPRGRRRPFIIWSTPLVVLFLALIPFGPDAGRWLVHAPVLGPLLQLSPIAPAILITAVFIMGFQVFDVFVGAVYYYLIVDTVPEHLLGRFYGFIGLVGPAAGLIFNLFILGHAEAHMKIIFVGVAVFYGAAIYLMCWGVKEGKHPPPPPLPTQNPAWHARGWAAARMYVTDCTRHPIYLWSFIAHAVATWAGASGVFAMLFYRDELGISLAIQGQIGSVNIVAAGLVALPLGYLIDKTNYFRVAQVGIMLKTLATALAWFLIRDPPTLLIMGLAMSLANLVYFRAMGRALIAIFPRQQYGQFGSANAAFTSLSMVFVALLAGWYVDWIGNYRAYLAWSAGFSAIAGISWFLLEKQFNRLGGRTGYRAP